MVVADGRCIVAFCCRTLPHAVSRLVGVTAKTGIALSRQLKNAVSELSLLARIGYLSGNVVEQNIDYDNRQCAGKVLPSDISIPGSKWQTKEFVLRQAPPLLVVCRATLHA